MIPREEQKQLSYTEERNTYQYITKLDKLFKDLQKIERDLVILLKERRMELESGFDTLYKRKEAATASLAIGP